MGKICCVGKAIDRSDFYGPDTGEIRFGRRLASAFSKASKELLDAWDTLDPQTAEQAYQAILRLPWQESFAGFQTEWEESTRRVMTEAGERSFRDLRGTIASPTSTLLAASFSVENPYSRVYIRERSSRLIVEITDQTREAVKDILDRAIREGQAPKVIREEIGDTVGLHRRWAMAVRNRKQRMREMGAPESKVQEVGRKYRKRLLLRRGENIARTEIVSASNQGTLDSWRIAQDNQWVPSNAGKQWIAGFGSARTCIHCGPMHSVVVGVNESFETSLGRVMRPPLHPSCRCTMGLVFNRPSTREVSSAIPTRR